MQPAPVDPLLHPHGTHPPPVLLLDLNGRVLLQACQGKSGVPTACQFQDVVITPSLARTRCVEDGAPVEARIEVRVNGELSYPSTLYALFDARGVPQNIAVLPAKHALGQTAHPSQDAAWERVLRITHDLANQLFILSGNLEMLEIHAAEQPEFLELLHRALPAAERARSLAREAHEISRQARNLS